jgi:hypothetical protein
MGNWSLHGALSAAEMVTYLWYGQCVTCVGSSSAECLLQGGMCCCFVKNAALLEGARTQAKQINIPLHTLVTLLMQYNSTASYFILTVSI